MGFSEKQKEPNGSQTVLFHLDKKHYLLKEGLKQRNIYETCNLGAHVAITIRACKVNRDISPGSLKSSTGHYSTACSSHLAIAGGFGASTQGIAREGGGDGCRHAWVSKLHVVVDKSQSDGVTAQETGTEMQ